MKVKLNKEEISLIYYLGKSQRQLANIYNVSEYRIFSFMKENNIKARRVGRPEKVKLDKTEITRLYDLGLSIRTIAGKLKVATPKVYCFMKENNIKTRNTAGNRMKVKR